MRCLWVLLIRVVRKFGIYMCTLHWPDIRLEQRMGFYCSESLSIDDDFIAPGCEWKSKLDCDSKYILQAWIVSTLCFQTKYFVMFLRIFCDVWQQSFYFNLLAKNREIRLDCTRDKRTVFGNFSNWTFHKHCFKLTV